MENYKIAFCNVSFGDKYVQTQKRLKDSILKIYPDATLFFWINELPPGSKPFQESLYGFKIHAIKCARSKGFNKIVWIDTCALLQNPIESLEFDGVYAIKDIVPVHRFCFDRLQHRLSKNWMLVGGSFYIFDFTTHAAEIVFNYWSEMESHGLFGTQQEIIQEKNDGIDKCGHRMDETCLSIAMYSSGVEPLSPDQGKYNQNSDSVVVKRHFLKEGEKWYNA